MNPQRILGIALLVTGVILVVLGTNASHSLADQVNNTFTGRFTERTTWYIIGGIGLALVGLLTALWGGGRRGLTR
jgi:drug/metabolite transporter (DMT)-like permease